MRPLMIVLLLLATPALASCASREEIAARQAAQQAAIDAQDDATCRSYGAQTGSSTYVSCRMNIANGRQQAAIVSNAMDQQLENQLILNSIDRMNGR